MKQKLSNPMIEAPPFRWLHFSDIHVGMGGQARLWPRSATVLLDDLETAHRKTGGFDCLIFSGDLTQSGTAAEFDQFDDILEGVLDRLGELGPRPPVLTVPGNHDLSRPDSLNPAAVALTQFWNQSALRERMWEKAGQPYLSFLHDLFGNFVSWRDRAIERGVHLRPVVTGLLPGDASYIIDSQAGPVGLIGLNSTWLQLGAGDYDGRLHVDAKQLLAITADRPDEWVRSNEINLLVTHQPASWLHAASPASWDNDINPSGRFDVHLFGHMHQPEVISVSHGGGLARRHVQAASLFGLETYGDGVVRIQGYSVNQIAASGPDRVLTGWPRRLIEVVGGRMKLAPDNTQEIDEETGSLVLRYTVERRRDPLSPPSSAPAGLANNSVRLAAAKFDLSTVLHPVAEARAHQKVRRLEQQACVNAFENRRAAWLISDWGMGEDGFLAAICNRIGTSRERVYSFDFNGFEDSDAFFDNLRTRVGATFQEVCDAIAEVGPSILILDDVDLSSSHPSTEQAIEALIGPVCDFAPDTRVLIRSRRRPRGGALAVVELSPLDEPDVAIYARESELGGERYAKPDAVSRLFRHTDGVPSRIDDALRDLEIVSLGDLLAANPDYGDAAATVSNVPSALVATVGELARSDDRAEERAYNLLLALSALPQGEQLSRITRFLGPHPFYASHARALLERSLIATVTITALDGMPGDSTQKALVVPRPVREYIRSIIDEPTARSFDRKAFDLYFGDDWASGNIQHSPTGKRVRNALCDGYEIQNASALILRSARRALVERAEIEIEGYIRLASALVETLIAGDHFRSAAALCDDVIRLLEEFGGYAREINVLRYELARSLRMCARLPEAQAAFQALDHSTLSKEQRQSAELGLALALQVTGDTSEAKEAAQRAISIDKKSNFALQAKTILAEMLNDPVERTVELRRLLVIARRDQSNTITNNILLKLAREEKDDAAATTMLKEVMQVRPGKHDFYNDVRAIVDLASRIPAGVRLGEAERLRLIDAYHFLYSERLVSLFDRCHAALWRDFERAGEVYNLLNLFRHSSFIWRLNGREVMEQSYLAKLMHLLKEILTLDPTRISRDGAYFIVRVSVVLGDIPALTSNPI